MAVFVPNLDPAVTKTTISGIDGNLESGICTSETSTFPATAKSFQQEYYTTMVGYKKVTTVQWLRGSG